VDYNGKIWNLSLAENDAYNGKMITGQE